MLLGLIILLVLLAWTLGNTITRSTHLSELEMRSRNPLRSFAAGRMFELPFHWSKVFSRALDWLSRFGLQDLLALKSPEGALYGQLVAATGRSSECLALLIIRDFEWLTDRQIPLERKFV